MSLTLEEMDMIVDYLDVLEGIVPVNYKTLVSYYGITTKEAKEVIRIWKKEAGNVA